MSRVRTNAIAIAGIAFYLAVGACGGGTKPPEEGVTCGPNGTGCSCSWAKPPNTVTCDGASVGGICCASPGWPKRFADCNCVPRNVTCKCDATGGTCDQDNLGTSSTCTKPAGGFCCSLHGGPCLCAAAGCNAATGYSVIPECNAAAVMQTCPTGTVEVSSCSSSSEKRD